GELDRAVPGDEDVLRRDVAVDDALLLAVFVGLAVRVVEPAADLLHDVRRQPVRHAPAELGALLQEAQEADALDGLHGEGEGRADLPEVEDLDDAGVVQAERDLRLVDEHADEVARARERRMDLLDDELLAEPLRDGAAGEEDLRHAAGADALLEL